MGCAGSKLDTYAPRSQYEGIDEHARTASNELRNSADDLVEYMKSFSKDHLLLVRGFYTWIAENIRYDIDGLKRRQARAPTDVTSVMKNGVSVCAGYASVMEALCSVAGIEVKTLSGYSKGYGYSADKPITASDQTSHAWNAVRLRGKWFLLDSTWGAGHTEGLTFTKEFNDFYFLTDPTEFIYDHFPYMDNNMKESQQWQLLKSPITLEEFNKQVQIKSYAFKMGIHHCSHKQSVIEMNDEIQMSFKCKRQKLDVSAVLSKKNGNIKQEIKHTTLVKCQNHVYTINVHPPMASDFILDIFAKPTSEEDPLLKQVAKYHLRCKSVKEANFDFPTLYASTYTEQCQVIRPRNARLPANSAVEFEIKAPQTLSLSVNKAMLQYTKGKFRGTITTEQKGEEYIVNVAFEEKTRTRYEGLFRFYTV